MRTKRHTVPARDLPGDVGRAFNLAGATTSDGWRDAAEQNQSAEDRQAAARRQGDMFPDVEGCKPSRV
jgi:hypothetical protein